MKFKTTISIILSLALTLPSLAQTPLWQGKGRIAISSDGNEHDNDDWAATPLSLAFIASQGLQDKLAVYTYSDHIWGSNQQRESFNGLTPYEQMRESALGGAKHFGFDPSRFFCAVDNAKIAYKMMAEQINLSSEENPLFIIAAGPMQVIGEALNIAEPEKRKYVTIITHTLWNNNHSDKPNNYPWDVHTGWTYNEMRTAFESAEDGGTKFIRIKGQNGNKTFSGLNDKRENFDWIKTSPARNHSAYKAGSWDWLYSRFLTCLKEDGKNFDASDAGITLFLFTGIEETSPELARKVLENPVVK